jgi:hypothetical protein
MSADQTPQLQARPGRRERIVASRWYKGWCWVVAGSATAAGTFLLFTGRNPLIAVTYLGSGSVFVSQRVAGHHRLYRGVQVLQAVLIVAMVVAAVVLLLRFGTLDPRS